jgi:hypothetical protein
VAVLFLSFGVPLSAATFRPYLIGNSVTDQSNYGDLETMAGSRGFTHDWGRDSIPGASIATHLGNPDAGFTRSPYGHYPNALGNFVWDAVTLQPFKDYAGELSAAGSMVDLVRQNSPDATIYVYAQYLNAQKDSWDGGDWLKDRNAPYIGQTRNADWFEDFTRDLEAAKPGNVPVRMIPVGHVFWELHQRMRAGMVPGFTNIEEVYKDGWHCTPVGDYIVMMTFFATFYGEDPGGMTRFPPYDFDPAVAAQIEAAAWEVVSRTPLSGRAAEFVVTTPSLARGLTQTAYSAQLSQVGGDAPVVWSLTAGALPDGLALAADGTLAGTPEANGIFPITVEASDADGDTAERDLILLIDSDSAPVIATSRITPTPSGGYLRESLEAEGGIGALTWSVVGGQLPDGLGLSPNGELEGTPLGPPGDYYFEVAVADENPSTPSVVSRELILNVLEPENGTYELGKTGTPPTVDGTLDEASWDLVGTADWRLEGAPDNAVSFGLLWDDDGLYIGVEIADGTIRSDSDSILQDDHVQIYLDGEHDRESEFNVDDRQILLAADGRFEETNGRADGMAHAVGAFAGGWRAEVFVPWTNFAESAVGPGPEGRFSLGFDLAVGDDDGGGEREGLQAWLSASDRDRSPNQFGNLVCHEAEMAENRLIDSGFALSPNDRQTLGFDEEIGSAQAGKGWYTGKNRAFSEGPLPVVGWPDRCIQTFESKEGSLLQIVRDDGATTGAGFLSMDVRNPDAVIAYRVYGYNGDPTTVDGKMAATGNDNPASAGGADAVLASGNLDPSGVPADTWRRVSVPVDFAGGYDYLLVALSASANLTAPRIDNVRLGPALGSRVTYETPPAPGSGRPRRELVVGGGFESGFAGTLGFGVEISTAEAGDGWYRNAGVRTLTSIDVSGGEPGGALLSSGGSGSSLLQLVRDDRLSRGVGVFGIDLYEPVPNQRFTVLGFRGTAADIDARLDAVTNDATVDLEGADGLIADGVLELDGAAPGRWHRLEFAADFGAGYDYVLVALGADDGVSGTRFDNVSLSADVAPTAAPEARIEGDDLTAAESGSDFGNFRLVLQEPLNFGLPVRLAYGGTAEGTEFETLPDEVLIPARQHELGVSIKPLIDAEPEGPVAETLTVALAGGDYTMAGAGATFGIEDHPADVWIFENHGGSPPVPYDKGELLLAYVTGTEPGVGGAARRLEVFLTETAGGQRTKARLRIDPAASGVAVELSISRDLAEWTAYATGASALELEAEQPNPGGTVTRTYRFPDDGTPAATAFVRLLLRRQ